MGLTDLEIFENERHNLICPWCGKDHLSVTVIENNAGYGFYRVKCHRCHHFVYLNRGNSMREWSDYCVDIITSCCKYPPVMAATLKEELEKLKTDEGINPVDLLSIMKQYKHVLEANAMNKKENEVDMVNHPSHYETGKYECIEVMTEALGREEVKGFCICNAFKYLYRCRRKNGLEDVKKAKWYIDKFIALCEEDLGNEDN